MKKAMLFSGGYDSTYLLNKLMSTEEELTIICISLIYYRHTKFQEKKLQEKEY